MNSIPFVVNVQCNGRCGRSFTDPNLNTESFGGIIQENLSRATLPLPTLVTAPINTLLHSLEVGKEWYERNDIPREIGGFHLECFGLSTKAGARGAHNPDYMVPATRETLDQLIEASGDRIKIVTLALDSEGEPLEVIPYARRQGISVMLGHQDLRGLEGGVVKNLRDALLVGAQGFTHFGNAAPAMIQKDNFHYTYLAHAQCGMYFCVITDGVHVSDSLLKILFRNVPKDRIIAVADDSPFAHSNSSESFEVLPGVMGYVGFAENEIGDEEQAVFMEGTDGSYLAGSWKDGFDCANYLLQTTLRWCAENAAGWPAPILDIDDIWKVLFYNPLRLLNYSVDEIQRCKTFQSRLRTFHFDEVSRKLELSEDLP